MRKYLYLLILVFLSSCTGVFHPKKDTLEINDIYHYGEISAATYKSNQEIKQAFVDYDEVTIREVPEIGGKYLVIKDNGQKVQFVAVRGTDNLENAFVDLEYIKEKDEILNIYLHGGFQRAAQEVYKEIKELELISPEYKTILIGHSLGGAVVGVLGAYLQADNYKLNFIITFGQPKFTNGIGAESLKKLPLVRVVNQGDLVPMIPPWTPLAILDGRYEHFGLELFIPESGSLKYLKVGETDGQDKTFSFWKNIWNEKINLEKHFISNYLEQLKKYLKEAVYIDYSKGFEWSRK